MTKWKGRAASYAPFVALGACIVNSISLDAAWAACTNMGGGNWVCSAANVTAQTVNANNVNVTTAPGFGITLPPSGQALTISGQGAQSYTDMNGSAIVANGFGTGLYMSTTNFGATPGTTTINSNGSFSGYNGVSVQHSANGAANVTLTGQITGTVAGGGSGVFVGSGWGDINLTTTGVIDAGGFGIVTDQSGPGTTTINASGDVTGGSVGIQTTTGYGNMGDITINAGTVTGSVSGITIANRGIGSSTIIATGPVVATGTSGRGIWVDTYSPFGSQTLDVNVTATDVTGRIAGILIDNRGLGDTTITTSGTVEAIAGDGINASNGTTAGDLVIESNIVTGSNIGIFAINQGIDATSVTSTGQVTGTSGNGIEIYNTSAGTDVTVDAVNVTGGSNGIYAENHGTGNAQITTTGTIEGLNSNGIYVRNYTDADDLIVDSNAVIGLYNGINVLNEGTGVTSVTATGQVTGTDGVGISTINTTAGAGVTVNAAGVTGGLSGIIATNNGSNALFVEATGQVTGATGDGIRATALSTATDVTVEADNVSGASSGITAINGGTGATTVTATGQVVGTSGVGVIARTSGTNVTVNANDVYGETTGIFARNDGIGTTNVIATGAVTGTTADGINATNVATATDLVVNAVDVTGGSTGILATNQGTGATSVTATGQVTGTTGNGIDVSNTSNGSNLTVNANNVTGGLTGIIAMNNGSDALSVRTTGQVTGADGDGIRAIASSTATDVTVEADNVSGTTSGITAVNGGAGATTVTATGQVVGTSGTGVVARAAGANLAVNANDVDGETTGIFARNDGIGTTNVIATGAVTGTTADGINAFNASTATDLVIDAADVTGGSTGILATNQGTGLTSVTATGQVTGTNDTGIIAYNTSTGTGVTVDANAVTGGSRGIEAHNNGTDATSVAASGLVSAGLIGIFVTGSTSSTDLTVDANAVTSGFRGIEAYNNGTGSTSVTVSGPVSATGERGIWVTGSGTTTDLAIVADDVTAGTDGIYAENNGTDATSITASGSVSAGENGIYVIGASTTTGMTVDANDVSGGINGIQTSNAGVGDTMITADGAVSGGNIGVIAVNTGGGDHIITLNNDVTGGTGAAIDTQTLSGSHTQLNINGGTISAASGIAILNNAGDFDAVVTAPAVVAGSVHLNDGTDNLTFDGSDISQTTGLDGGDDVSTADGMIDTLTFANLTGTPAGANLQNWERIVVDSGTTLGFSDSALTTGSDPNMGLFINSGGTLIGSVPGGQFTVTGNATNAGLLRLDDGAAGDRFVINGAYEGAGGALQIDTVLGDDSSPTDRMIVNGGTSGTTTLSVDNIGGIGAITVNGIQVVQVNGTSDGTFSLAGGAIAIPGWTYGLEKIGLSWYLRSTCSASATLGCVTIDTLTASGNTIVAGDMEGAGGSDGITVSGDASVTGVVRGGGAGIDNSAANDTDDRITIDTTGTIGGIEGNLGNDMVILTAGTVTGETQGNEGNDTLVLQGAGVAGLTGNDGDDRLEWLSGTLTGFDGGSGSDEAVITAVSYLGSEQLDGGDDVSSADGMIDTLTLSDLTVSATGANVTNWENVVVNGGAVSFFDGALTTGSDTGTGLSITNGGTLDGGNAFALTGNMTVASTGMFEATGAGAGIYSISGALINSGLVSFRDGTAGDRLTVAGNYAGNDGVVEFDVALGTDSSQTDRLVINGSTSGSTFVSVANAGGTGAPTVEGIKIVDVGGASDGTFALVSDYVFQGDAAVVAGAYSYRLFKNGVSTPADGDWYLRSTLTDPVDPVDPVDPPRPHFQPGVPIFEAYPQILLGLNGLPTLRQRVGNRFWSGGGAGVVAEGADAAGEPALAEPGATATEGRGFWGRIEGAHTRMDPSVSTSGADYDYNLYKMQAGLDAPLYDNEAGALIGGLVVNYGHASAGVTSVHGNGDIRTDGYGFGGTLTWYGSNGFYVDAQSQFTWYDSDLNSDDLGRLADGNDGFGYALSLEGGQRIELPNGLAITPQAQLVYSSVDFDAFTQTLDGRELADVSMRDGDSLRGRLGIALDRQTSWQADNGLLSRGQIYGIANLQYEFLDGTAVDVSGVSFSSRNDRLWGGAGVGGSYNWNDDKFSLYGEGSFNTSLADFGDSYELKGTAGFRMKW